MGLHLLKDAQLDILYSKLLRYENVKNSPIQLFKKNTILLYVGKCRESIIVSANGEKWVGKKDIYERQFGYIVDFILGEEKLHVKPKIGDIVYADPYTGELVPFQIENDLLPKEYNSSKSPSPSVSPKVVVIFKRPICAFVFNVPASKLAPIVPLFA